MVDDAQIGKVIIEMLTTIANFLATYILMSVAIFLLGGVLLLAKELKNDRRGVAFTEKYCDKRL